MLTLIKMAEIHWLMESWKGLVMTQCSDTCVLDDDRSVCLGQDMAGQDMAEKEINVAKKEVSTADPVTTAGEVVTTASVEVSTASPTKTTIADDLTLAQTLIEIRSAKPKVKGVVIGEQNIDTELVEGSEVRIEGSETREKGSFKRARDELEQESTKKQKVDEDRETVELQSPNGSHAR
ncbi:hypothetical protein Tco_1030165 [Tanacetum coccineum]|uniref:Uncharacterized protein n=1 Tax=Tanacetum coccineum TaxID=301880 RepID=A0ABQ5G766_9ASTR